MHMERRRRAVKWRHIERQEPEEGGSGGPCSFGQSRRQLENGGCESDSDSDDDHDHDDEDHRTERPFTTITAVNIDETRLPPPTFGTPFTPRPFLEVSPTPTAAPTSSTSSPFNSPPSSPTSIVSPFRSVDPVTTATETSSSPSLSSSSSSTTPSSSPTPAAAAIPTASPTRGSLPPLSISLNSSPSLSPPSTTSTVPPSPQFENAPDPTTSRIRAPPLHPHFDLSFLLPVIIGTVTVTLGLTLLVAQMLRKRRRKRRAEERMRVGLAMLDLQAKEEQKSSWIPGKSEKPPLPPPQAPMPAPILDPARGAKRVDQRITLPPMDPLKGDPVAATREMESSNPALHRRLLRRLAGLSVATSSHSHTKSTTTAAGGLRAKIEGFIKRSARVDAEMRLQGMGRLAGGGSERQQEADAMPMKEKMEESEKKGFEHPLGAWAKMTSWGNESQYWKKPMPKKEPAPLTEVKVDIHVSRFSKESGETTAV